MRPPDKNVLARERVALASNDFRSERTLVPTEDLPNPVVTLEYVDIFHPAELSPPPLKRSFEKSVNADP